MCTNYDSRLFIPNMGDPTEPAIEGPKPKLHVIESFPENIILQKTFRPFVIAGKFLGVLPLQMNLDGSASTKLFSIPTIYSLIFFFCFVFDSIIYVPQIHANVIDQTNGVTKIAHYIFASGQYLGLLFTLLLVPYITPRLVRFWNNLQTIITYLATNGTTRMFIPTYNISRRSAAIWFTFTLIFGLSTSYSFASIVKKNVAIGGNWSGVLNCILLIGLVNFCTMMAFHGLHSMMFITFVCALKRCFISISEQAIQTFEVQETQKKKLQALLSKYEKVNDLIADLGNIYGVYMILQMISMMTGTTTSVFFLLSSSTLDTNGLIYYSIAAVLTHTGWLYYICDTGELLRNEARACQISLRKSSVKCQISESLILEKLVDAPVGISACGYFSINRKLFTTIIGTITTYLIVMLQFKLTSPEGIKSQEPTPLIFEDDASN